MLFCEGVQIKRWLYLLWCSMLWAYHLLSGPVIHPLGSGPFIELMKVMHMATYGTNFVVEWRDGFKVGVTQVDAEHRHLFTLIKALNIDNVDATLNELLDYVVTHFSNEQELMEKSGYPEFQSHLVLHEEFSAHVADFLSGSGDWDADRLIELRRFLNKWLVGHILTHDLRFGRWYQEQGKNTSVKVVAPQPTGPKVGWFDRMLGRG